MERNGQCFKKCDETKCLAGNYCFVTEEQAEGFCGQPCTNPAGTECGMGYTCTPATSTTLDGTSYAYYCKNLGLPHDGVTGTACTADAQCAPGYGLQCLAGICALKCDVSHGCTEGFECKGIPNAPATGPTGYCATKGPDWGAGHYGTDCPSGKSTVCDSTNNWLCVGPAGKGYCSKKDGCTKDADCPSQYWCGSARVASGKIDVDFSQQPKVCLKRGFCSPCSTDIDCSLQVGAICVPDKNGEGLCSYPCEKDTNACEIGAECKDTGSGVYACVPDVGTCHVAAPQGCSPCRVDTDCGANAICANGSFGNKAGMSWCMAPCGPADASGKPTCSTAPNGLEMLCMDETELGLGGPFKSDDGTTPNYMYAHCYAPFTVDTTEIYDPSDPPRNVCGNFVREGDEECDDGNKKETDGCDSSCKVTPACTFAILEPNGDVWDDPPLEPALDPTPNHLSGTDYDPRMKWVVSTNKCNTFKITGALEKAGDIDTIALQLDGDATAWLDTYTGGIGKCNADLKTEIRPWGNGVKTADLTLLDPAVKCEGLSDTLKNLDAANPTLCSSGHIGCGSCTAKGICGACDDDNGYGDCTRMLISTSLTYGSYKIDFDGKYKLIRVYAKDPTATVSEYTMVVSKFVASSQSGTATPPGLSCY